MSIALLFADDHEIVRYGLCLLLDAEPDIDVVGQAANAVETLALAGQLHPDVVLLDFFMPGVSGTSLIADLHATCPEVRIVMMSGHASEQQVREAMQVGAMAFVRKDDEVAEMVKAIRAVVAGERYLCPHLAQLAYGAYADDREPDEARRLQELTEREAEVIRLAAGGMTSELIGRHLFISRRTVETHRARAMHKLDLHNEVELARFFLKLESDAE
jgi:DNA-binding NarL/FixJ family response regulator